MLTRLWTHFAGPRAPPRRQRRSRDSFAGGRNSCRRAGHGVAGGCSAAAACGGRNGGGGRGGGCGEGLPTEGQTWVVCARSQRGLQGLLCDPRSPACFLGCPPVCLALGCWLGCRFLPLDGRPGTNSSFHRFCLFVLCLWRLHEAALLRLCLCGTLVRILILPRLCILPSCLQAASLSAGPQKAVDVDVGGNSVVAGGVRSTYL